MNNLESNSLDSDELLHLAVVATREEKFTDSLTLLKRSLELDPENAKAMYLLAAVHAQIGLYERAMRETQKALEIEPSFHDAAFQLGLLHLMKNDYDEARQVWSTLEDLDEGHYLKLFAQGFTSLMDQNAATAMDLMRQGIANNHANQALNRGISEFVEQLKSYPDDQDENSRPEEFNPNFLLSAYQSNGDDTEH